MAIVFIEYNNMPVSKRKYLIQSLFEKIIIRLAGNATVVILALIIAFLFFGAVPFAFEYNLFSFFTGIDWYPLSNKFGSLPLIYGSFFVTIFSTLIAIPLSIAVSLFISEIANPKLRTFLKVILEILASIPSVVFGFLGIILVGPAMETIFHIQTGLNVFTASLLLAFMSIPTIASVSEESLQAVPRNLREGSLALGATKLQTMIFVTLPSAQAGIVAGIMLGVGRAIGETMTVMMVAGGSAQISLSIFAPIRTITGTIATEMGEVIQGDTHYHSLFMLGLVLFLVTLTINSISSIIIKKIKKG